MGVAAGGGGGGEDEDEERSAKRSVEKGEGSSRPGEGNPAVVIDGSGRGVYVVVGGSTVGFVGEVGEVGERGEGDNWIGSCNPLGIRSEDE